jgi:3-polyprenyl-4-hydroxybenzoate decarboxylase
MTSGRRLAPETPFTNEMHIREIIRQSDSYVYWFDKYFTRKGLAFLVEEVAADDVDEIKILTGTAQTDHRLRRDFEKFKEEMEEHPEINWSQVSRGAFQEKLERLKTFQEIEEIAQKSKLTEEDVEEISKKVKDGLADEYLGEEA